MGIARIISDLDFRRIVEIIVVEWPKAIQAKINPIQTKINHWRIQLRDERRGWSESDIESLKRKLEDPRYYNGGICKITYREHRSWSHLNRRLLAENPKMIRSPVLAWAEGKGLCSMIRLLPSGR